jgi:Trk-type K+ transport system membrane component
MRVVHGGGLPETTMKPKLDSYLRHIFTTLITAFVVAITGYFSLDAEQAKAVTEGLAKMGDGAVAVLLVIAPVMGRLLWAWGSKIFQSGSGETGNGPAGGLGLFVIMMIGVIASGLFGGLTSCTPAQMDALRAVPIRVGVETPDSRVSYSSKGGLVVEARVIREK